MMSLKELIEKRVEVVSDPDTKIEDIQAIVCTFYRSGHCPSCRGCEQQENIIRECSESYVAKILTRPMHKWSKAFDKVTNREKIPIAEADEIGLNCNTCYMYDKCPKSEKDMSCAFDWGDTAFSDQNADSAINAMISLQMRRVSRAEMFEQMDGGVPDQTLSGEIDRLTKLLEAKQNFKTTRVKATLEVNAPHAISTGENNQPVKGGLLAQIFGTPQVPEKRQIEAPQVNVNSDDYIEAEVVKVTPTPPRSKKQ